MNISCCFLIKQRRPQNNPLSEATLCSFHVCRSGQLLLKFSYKECCNFVSHDRNKKKAVACKKYVLHNVLKDCRISAPNARLPKHSCEGKQLQDIGKCITGLVLHGPSILCNEECDA